jgi:hypothetical protein
MQWDRQGKIAVNRFDTVKIDSRAWANLLPGEILFFGLYEFGNEFNECFIAKQATAENPIIEFTEEETKYKPGRYRYQVKVQKENGDVKTVQGETLFVVLR